LNGIKGEYMIEIIALLELDFQCKLALHGLTSLHACIEARKKGNTSGQFNLASSIESVRSAYSVLEHSAIVGRPI
jgi:hypothetical protein